MLFSGDAVNKQVAVLSGGEKARAMFSKIMLGNPNFILFDEPTDHLDLEAISSLNKGLIDSPVGMMLTSHDFELLNTVGNRVIEVSPEGMIDHLGNFEEYMANSQIQTKRQALYPQQ